LRKNEGARQLAEPNNASVSAANHYPAHNLLIDNPLGDHSHRELGKRRLPLFDLCARSDIGVQEMPSWAQYARNFCKKPRKPRIEVRCFDIDHRVEGLVIEREVLGVAVHEIQTGQIMCSPTKRNAFGFRSKPV
jgi:hypothetical protein